MSPKLSVIMTVYNGEAFIQETLDAVFSQTFTDFEMVVVNNGSTDGTQAILDGVDDARLRVVQAPRHGSFGDGIRLAYDQAKGDYLAVQDADDVPPPDRFEKQVAALDGDAGLGLVSGAYQDMDENGNLAEVHHPPSRGRDLVDAFQVRNPLAHSTFMFRRAAASEVGGYPPEYDYGPDFGLAIRMMKKGWRVKVLDDVILKLRLHAGQASNAPALNTTRCHNALYLYQEAAALDGVSPSACDAGRRNITKYRILYGLALLGDGRMGAGLGNLFGALARHPLYSAAYLGYRFGRRLGLVSPGAP